MPAIEVVIYIINANLISYKTATIVIKIAHMQQELNLKIGKKEDVIKTAIIMLEIMLLTVILYVFFITTNKQILSLTTSKSTSRRCTIAAHISTHYGSTNITNTATHWAARRIWPTERTCLRAVKSAVSLPCCFF